MSKQRQLLIILACTLAMVISGIGALAEGAWQEGAQIKKAEVSVLVDGSGMVEVLPLLDSFWIQQGGRGGPATGGADSFFRFEQAEFSFGGKVVKGAPYSADAVTETVQVLGDGNRIVKHSASKIYRDGEGRERREQSLSAVGPWLASGDQPQTISINDPVSGVNYILDPNKQTARKVTMAAGRGGGGGARGGGPPTAAVVTGESRAAVAAGGAAGGFGGARGGGGGVASAATTETRVATVRPLAQDVDPAKLQAEVQARAAGALAQLGGQLEYARGTKYETKTEQLGKQSVGGVEAEGTRTTTTIPIGAIGNEMPINMISERWFSPELQVVVMTKNSDPRTGETTYRLTNIIRTEPVPSLFQVPGGYKVEETQMRMAVPSIAPIKKPEDK